MKIGILTSGGDCPGLNAVIRGIVLKAQLMGSLVYFKHGWRGVVEGSPFLRRQCFPTNQTILGSSRTNPMRDLGPETSSA
jgi:6-phosphofructokinase 1